MSTKRTTITLTPEDDLYEAEASPWWRLSSAEWNGILIVTSVGLIFLAGVWWAIISAHNAHVLLDPGTGLHYGVGGYQSYTWPTVMVLVATPLFWFTVLHAVIRSAVRGALKATR